DIENYLHDEPVQACPPSALYRLRKLLRRHQGAVLAVSAVILALVGGIVATTWGLVRADNAREQAVQAQQAEAERAEGEHQAKQEALAAAEAEKQAKETAQAREAETRAVLDFVKSKILAAARPKGWRGGLGPDVTLRRAVEAALPFVDQSFTQQPLVEAQLRSTLGISFAYLGDAKIAAEQFEKACTICQQHYGPDHPDTLSNMQNQATSYHELGRLTDALRLREVLLKLRKEKLPPNHPD